MKRILMIANDNERWGPARLPEPLSKAGVEVAVLCPAQNPLSQSSFLSHHYDLDELKSWRRFGRKLRTVMSDWKPDLIIPCDEFVVAMIHFFLKRPAIAARYLDVEQLSVLRRSIGNVDRLDAMLLKHQTRCLAESLGVPVPKSHHVTTAGEAEEAATRLGFPAFLKESFSWAGQGAILCNNPAQLRETFVRLTAKTSWVKGMARRALARDWYYTTSDVEVQQAISGESVMYSVAALDGKMLGGLFARRSSKLSATGPSTAVTIGENSECRWMVEKMVAAMGASGFLAFDFMQCENTGKFFMLECNPRPNQIFHLGQKLGSDLCKLLAEGLKGYSQTSGAAQGDAVVPLFPQTWLHDEPSALAMVDELDIPRNDAKLLGFMLRRGQKEGRASLDLADLLKSRGLVPANYTFG